MIGVIFYFLCLFTFLPYIFIQMYIFKNINILALYIMFILYFITFMMIEFTF
jgi:hypothetical protein